MCKKKMFFLKARIFEKFGTQADFAKRVKVDETLVSRVIRGRRELSKEAQEKWSRALGLPSNFFVE